MPSIAVGEICFFVHAKRFRPPRYVWWWFLKKSVSRQGNEDFLRYRMDDFGDSQKRCKNSKNFNTNYNRIWKNMRLFLRWRTVKKDVEYIQEITKWLLFSINFLKKFKKHFHNFFWNFLKYFSWKYLKGFILKTYLALKWTRQCRNNRIHFHLKF